MKRFEYFVLMALLLFLLGPQQLQAQTGTLAGRVVDLQTGEPIAKAAVSVAGLQQSATTDQDGRFTLGGVGAGSVELRVFTVGYGLLRARVSVTADGTTDVELRLGQDAVRDEITVVAGPFEPVVPDAATQYSLDNSELQDLSTILANDPLRAVASLPGVSANQDYYADFAVRGAGPAHVGVYVDGALVDHPSYSLEDAGDLGSLSVINGDLVRSLSLLSGGFPASYGNRTGAILDMATRDGARDRVVTRVIADVLGAAVTSEGPIGRGKKASWLVSGRQSYLGYLLSQLGISSSLTLNYNDGSGRLNYDLGTHHRFAVYSSFGSTSAARSPDNTAGQAASNFTAGGAQHGMTAAHWDWIASRHTLLQTQGFWIYDHEHDTNATSAVDLDTATDVYGFRADLTRQFGKANKVQAGVESRSPWQQRNSYTQWNYATDILSTGLIPLDTYSRSEWQPGAYLQDTVSLLKNRVSLGVGGRWAYSAPASQNVWLPHASAIVKASRTTNVTVAFGQYAQTPSLLQLYGAFGNSSLRAERATHETVAVDQFFTEKVRLHVDLYNRSEHEDVYSPLTEFRLLANGQVGFPAPGPVLGNSLEAYGRGFEVSLQRRSANRLSGWVAYGRNYSQYWQPNTSFRFDGDYDQRSTFSAYGAYRITRTIDVSGNTRYGSGFPIPGFLASSTVQPTGSNSAVYYQLSGARNTLRQDNYLRNDVRINKVFTAKRFNLTVHGEIENLTGHVNYCYYGFRYPGNIASSHQVDARRQSTLPFLPAAGFTLEF